MANIIFFGGKGGVGKTTCSSAYAIKSAESGLKTLLVSTDPAHSIADVFEMKIGRNVIEIRNNLDGLEIDSAYESQKYINGIRGNLGTILSPIVLEEINKQLDAAAVSPGSHESAMFDKMIEIINDYSSKYDRIIFDTAPTGHTIRLLSLPELLEGWIETLIAKRRKALAISQMAKRKIKDEEAILNDPIVKILMRRKKNMEKARHIMIDNRQLNFIFVLNAEKLPIEETKKAISALEKYEIPVQELIINRILPENVQDEFMKEKKAQERHYLNEIENVFGDKKLHKLPWRAKDVRAETIDELAKELSL
ncbi:MAG: ArsA family ATPase [Tissierellales bacterium]|jgi:arsenite-transporting ATPase|nr:ArsA family ATPase [Tissierellales bacterium]